MHTAYRLFLLLLCVSAVCLDPVLAQEGRYRERLKEILQERQQSEASHDASGGVSLEPLESYSVDTPEVRIDLIAAGGGRMDWSKSGNNKIAFDKRGPDGYYDIYLMNPDGSSQQCITCDSQGRLPQKHNGNPAWHPSGSYIVFQVEKESVPKQFDGKASPGSGAWNDLWVTTPDRQCYRIVGVSDRLKDAQGTLHAHFSHDGKQLVWAQRIGNGTITQPKSLYGKWVLKVADFVEDPQPHLERIRTYHPGEQWDFYESHDFSPDGSKILFSGNLQKGQPGWGLDIYEMHLATGKVTNLTQTRYVWDEHAHYSPDGAKIVWMSSQGYDLQKGFRTDFWLMDANGANQKQLTFFNQSGNPQYIAGKDSGAADSSFSPDGTRIAGLINFTSRARTGGDPNGSVVVITLKK